MNGPLGLVFGAAALWCWVDGPRRLPRRSTPPAVRALPGRWRVLLVGAAAGLAVLVIRPTAVLVAVGVGVSCGLLAHWEGRRRSVDPTEVDGEFALLCDLWAAGLDAGLPTGGALSAALAVTAPAASSRDGPGPSVRRLGQVAGLLRVGADEDRAWRPAADDVRLAPIALAAQRAHRAGAELAAAVREQATVARRAAAALDERRAHRAGVLITAPLTLCFLPAFICLGLAPVVVALVGTLDLGP